MPDFRPPDFNRSPLIVIWEITRACPLACVHCRAEAQPLRHPDELSFEEGCRLMDQAKAMDVPIFVLTGGDPLSRPDFFDLIAYGQKIGLRVSTSPSGTRRVTVRSMQRAKAAGCPRVAISLDGATPLVHDAFRGVRGQWAMTMDAIRNARTAGLEVQIGTTVTRRTVRDLPAIVDLLVHEIEPKMWNVFFLVPVGRGQAEDMLSPEEHEEVLKWLWDVAKRVPFAVKTTEAPFFRRIALQDEAKPVGFGVGDGKGFVFISHVGDICPSGFLEVAGGNIRQHRLADVYQNHPLFRDLRDPSKLKGRCGACEYKAICGGSRARAWAVTGDWLETDPACAYIPQRAAAQI